MASFGVVAGGGVDEYMTEMQYRLDHPQAFALLWVGKVRKRSGLWVYLSEPLFPKLYAVGALLLAGTFIANYLYDLGYWNLFFLIPSGLFMSTYLFWWSGFHKFLLWLSLRRRGVKPSFVVGDDLIKELM